MEVVKGVENCWNELGWSLGILYSKLEEIRRLYQSDHQRMEATLNYYVRHYHTPLWKEVARALHEIKLHKHADEVTTKYVKGMDVNHV